jgi:tryptophanyl-tRNA synthetase
MSKSDPSDYSRINMTDDADTIVLKIRKAKTDPAPLPDSPAGLEGRAEAANLLGLYGALSETSLEDVCRRFAGASFSDFKKELADLSVSVLGPIQNEMRRLAADPGHVDGVLSQGAGRAHDMAAPILAEIEKIVGYLRP